MILIVGCRPAGDPFAAALAEARPGEARLAGAPWVAPEADAKPPTAVLGRALHAAEHAARKNPTAAALREAAVVDLLVGEVDRAVDALSRAAELGPSNAAVWSDLAAAHLQRSATAADPYEIVLSLAAANRAVRRDPALLAARFNRALALERLSLDGPAAAEWQRVLAHERDPLWAREARAHAAALERRAIPRDEPNPLAVVQKAVEQGEPERVRPLVAGAPQSFREHLEGRLFARWAAAENAGRTLEAARELAVAEAVAEALAAAGGDRMAAETIARIEPARTREDGSLQRLVKGFLAYSQGLDLNASGLYGDAMPHFQEAREALAAEQSPMAHLAAYQVALCRYQNNDYPRARADLVALARDPASAPYRALQGRARLLVGLIEGHEGNYAASIEAMEVAEADFRAIGEAANAAKVSATLATAFDFLGRRQEAWRRLYPALVEPSSLAKPAVRFSVYEDASWLAWREGESEIALSFQDEVVSNARAMGRPEALVGALRQRAAILAALGRKAEAARDVARARDFLQQISDPALRRAVTGDLLLAEGEIAGPASPGQAIARLDEAVRILRETDYHLRLGHAFYQRARAELSLGRLDAAEDDLAAAIAELERQRQAAPSPGDRISYLDREKEILDAMIAFQLEKRRRPDAAFRFSEQAKARVLWDWMAAAPAGKAKLPAQPRPLDLAALQRGLPRQTALIEYAVLPGKIVFWVLRHGELQCETVATDAGSLEELVRRLRGALRAGRADELRTLSEQAYDLLIRPVAHHLAAGERLVLIPDGALHSLPFAVLRDRTTERFLVQDHVLVVASSARTHVACRRRDVDLERSSGGALIVAAPEFDRAVDPSLQPLSAGETEAAIARILPGSQVLAGRDATRGAFLRAAGRFPVLHFGGHSVVNENFPLLSQMLFAPHPADPARGVLYSGDVLRRRFPRTRLVVLASCGSATGKLSRTEGVESLARSFLAVGVPSVVASLWSVDDQATAEFFVRFYRQLKKDFDVAGALRAVQLDEIERGGAAADPRVWGAFEVIGGGGEPSTQPTTRPPSAHPPRR